MTCTLAICLLAGHFTITDGDTIRAGDLRIRIWGVDAPEMAHPGGSASRSALIQLTHGTGLSCEAKGSDRYHRTVARCQLTSGPHDGQDVACLMVAGGWAMDWPKYSGGYYAGCGK